MCDTPDEAAYHLVSAMGCCDIVPTNNNTTRIMQSEILSLESNKNILESDLQLIETKLVGLPTLAELATEIKFLNNLILELEGQNERARSVGLANLQTMAAEFCRIEHEHSDLGRRNVQFSAIYQQELETNRNLKAEIDGLLLRIKHLHDRNNQIVRMY